MAEFEQRESESFNPIDHIWELQSLKEKEKNLHTNLITICLTMGVNGAGILALATKPDHVKSMVTLLEMFIAECGIVMALSVSRDHIVKEIESIEDLFKNLDGRSVREIKPQITSDSGDEIIKA